MNPNQQNPRMLGDDALEGLLSSFFQSEVPAALRGPADESQSIDDLVVTGAQTSRPLIRLVPPVHVEPQVPSNPRAIPASPVRAIVTLETRPARESGSRSLAIPAIAAACLLAAFLALLQPIRQANQTSGGPESLASNKQSNAANTELASSPKEPARNELVRTANVTDGSGSEDDRSAWHDQVESIIAGRPSEAFDSLVPFSILEHVEPVERSEFNTQDGPVELQSKRNILRVQYDDPETGSHVEMTIPELDIQVFPLDEPSAKKPASGNLPGVRRSGPVRKSPLPPAGIRKTAPRK